MMRLQIKQVADSKGIQMGELARRLGIRQSSLTQAIARNNFNLEYLDRIASALGVEIPELFASDSATITCPHCGKTITIKMED